MKKSSLFLLALFLVSVSYTHGFAQSADVDPTIGNIGMLLGPTRPALPICWRAYPGLSDPKRLPGRPDHLFSADGRFTPAWRGLCLLTGCWTGYLFFNWDARAARMTMNLEVTRPWKYYSVLFCWDGITVEFARSS